MLATDSILKLYANVMNDDIAVNAIPESEIRAGIRSMTNVYLKKADYSTTILEFPNYNDTSCRCAYLHKYAPLHTYIVEKVMIKILDNELALFQELVVNTNCFRFCSLGGGPGSDVIGVLAALNTVFASFNSHATVIDCMERWSLTFMSVLSELKFGCYGAKWQNLATNFKWNYIGANLLCSMTDEVNKTIGTASFITMVKFLSASTCANTEEMVDKIFRVMKPGALVLFIDNAAGGFTQIVERAGRKNGLVPKFGPLRHEVYEVEDLRVDRFGHPSCVKTRVTIILLQKALNYRQIRNNFNPSPNTLNYVVPPAKTLDFVVLDNDDSCRDKLLNMDNNRPPQLIKQTPPDLKTQKPPVPSSVIEQNKVAVSKSKTNSVPGLPTSVRNDLFAKVDNLKPGSQTPNASTGQMTWNISATKPRNEKVDNLKPGLQKPNAFDGQRTWNISATRPGNEKVDNLKPGLQTPNASAGQMILNISATKPGNLSPYVDPFRTAVQSSKRNNSGANPEQRRPNKPAASKSTVRNAPTSAYKPISNSSPKTTVRSYQPPSQPAREMDDSSEGCCGCCVIS